MKARISKAQIIQKNRFKDPMLNSSMSNKQLLAHSNITDEAKEFLDAAAKKLDISARVYMKLLKISRTIADLENSDRVEKKHIAEALQYRPVNTI
jgi:magnesium chelatase family protein